MSNPKKTRRKKTSGYRPGVSEKNGKLYVFSKSRIIVIKGWPEIAAWTKTAKRPQWKRFRPDISLEQGEVRDVQSRHRFHISAIKNKIALLQPTSLVGIEHTEMDQECFKAAQAQEEEKNMVRNYFSNVPSEIRELVSKFPSRQWHLLAMASRCSGAAELLRDVPALGFALASNWVFRKTESGDSMKFIRRVSHLRRVVISSELGFGDSESSVGILKKIPPFAVNVSWLLALRDLMKEDHWRKVFRHLPKLSVEVVMVIAHPIFRKMVTSAFLNELVTAKPETHEMLRETFLDSLRMESQLDARDERPKTLRSFAQLVHYHDRLVRRINREKEAEVLKCDFPPPPFAGTADIVALDTPKKLIKEAREQKNCVMSLAGDVSLGTKYLYQVKKPERATMSVIRNKSGKWTIDEVAGPCNQRVSPQTKAAMIDWVKNGSE